MLLAIGYLSGVGRKTDVIRSLEFLKKGLKSEDVSHSDSCHYLIGFYYLLGIGTDKDHILAFKHFQISANKKFEPAWNALGICYLKGYGTFRNYNEAFNHFTAAEKSEDPHPN